MTLISCKRCEWLMRLSAKSTLHHSDSELLAQGRNLTCNGSRSVFFNSALNIASILPQSWSHLSHIYHSSSQPETASNHHLGKFSHALWRAWRMVRDSQNGALTFAAIKSTRLVANLNRPEGTCALPVSPYHTTKNHQTPPPLAIPNQLPYSYTPR